MRNLSESLGHLQIGGKVGLPVEIANGVQRKLKQGAWADNVVHWQSSLPSLCKAWGSIPSTSKEKNKRRTIILIASPFNSPICLAITLGKMKAFHCLLAVVLPQYPVLLKFYLYPLAVRRYLLFLIG
jgi:hypothetical protein